MKASKPEITYGTVVINGQERRIPIVDPEPDEIEAVRRGGEAIARGEYVRLEDLQRELGLPTKSDHRLR